MAVILLLMGLSLLMQGCLCIDEQFKKGCMDWTPNGDNVCCKACYPGNHLVIKCGPNPKDLCKPCQPGTFTMDPQKFSCTRCTQCVGAQVQLESCTATTDTKCGCKEGLTCGDEHCSFCVDTCGKGHEPTPDRSCRPCPNGTFNDKIHQKCKPWSAKCPHPNQHIVAKGNAVSDITCGNVTVAPVINPTKPDPPENAWPLVLSVVTTMFLISVCATIFIVAVKILHKKKKTKKPIPKTPIIRTPTDDPRTLIAIECSFHEAQQEQGSSSESLNSSDSSGQLIA